MKQQVNSLSFVNAPDYENPGSATSDNAYKVAVVATDNAGNTAGQLVTVNITDLDETNSIYYRSILAMRRCKHNNRFLQVILLQQMKQLHPQTR